MSSASANQSMFYLTENVFAANKSFMLFRTLVMIHQCFPLQLQSVCSFSVTANQVKHNLPVFGFLWLHNINSVPTSSSSSCTICRPPTARHTYCIGADFWLGPENSFVSTLPWIYFKIALHALALTKNKEPKKWSPEGCTTCGRSSWVLDQH